MLVFLVYMGATYTEIKDGHVKVSFISARFDKKWQNALDIFFLVGGVTILPLLTWQTFDSAMHSLEIREMALDYPIPVYPSKFVIPLGFFFLSIQFLLNLTTRVFELVKHKQENGQ